MEQKLGQIEKPKVAVFLDARKLFCLPLIPSIKIEEDSKDLRNSIDLFWQEAGKQIDDLERAGKISYVFYETVTKDGEAGLEMVKQISEQSSSIVKEKMGQGAELVIMEDEEVLDEFLDWSICLSVVRKSKKVQKKILEFYRDALKRRFERNVKTIDDTIKNSEAALLIMTEDNRMQIQSYLPSDIEVFLIHPPALNDFQRCFSDYWKKQIDKTQD
ncbi:hypothetical protein ACFLRN_09700 [Thermoproteota archaeon]